MGGHFVDTFQSCRFWFAPWVRRPTGGSQANQAGQEQRPARCICVNAFTKPKQCSYLQNDLSQLLSSDLFVLKQLPPVQILEVSTLNKFYHLGLLKLPHFLNIFGSSRGGSTKHPQSITRERVVTKSTVPRCVVVMLRWHWVAIL